MDNVKGTFLAYGMKNRKQLLVLLAAATWMSLVSLRYVILYSALSYDERTSFVFFATFVLARSLPAIAFAAVLFWWFWERERMTVHMSTPQQVDKAKAKTERAEAALRSYVERPKSEEPDLAGWNPAHGSANLARQLGASEHPQCGAFKPCDSNLN